MHARSLVSSLSAAALLLGLGVVFTACGKQGIGERCSTDNGNDDCDTDLICSRSAGVCCPVGDVSCGTAAVTDSGPGDTKPAETSPPADTAADTVTDTGTSDTTDAPADTATESAVDAADAESGG
jgi:hypothetical protein